MVMVSLDRVFAQACTAHNTLQSLLQIIAAIFVWAFLTSPSDRLAR